ncbi:MAG: hypothetical protein RL149_153 [Actinomycetota bacterium]
MRQVTFLSMSKLMVGLYIYGLALAMVIKAHIGVPPWDVFAQGLSHTFGMTYGQASIVVSIIVLLAWIPLKVKPGIGSILNGICIGLFADLWMPYVPDFDSYWANLAMFLFGMATVAFATGLYISANLGSGPRDGLMLGTQKVLKWPFWAIRTMYEATVLAIGWALGGQVREGTLIFAICIGYLMQASLKFFKVQK